MDIADRIAKLQKELGEIASEAQVARGAASRKTSRALEEYEFRALDALRDVREARAAEPIGASPILVERLCRAVETAVHLLEMQAPDRAAQAYVSVDGALRLPIGVMKKIGIEGGRGVFFVDAEPHGVRIVNDDDWLTEMGIKDNEPPGRPVCE